MKKIISLLLALVMAFSMCSVAFATDGADINDGAAGESTVQPGEGDGAEDSDEDSILGEYDWILDLPFGTVKPALKVAKIVLKLAKVYIKLGIIFGIVDKDALIDQVSDFIGSLIGDDDTATEEAPADGAENAPAEDTAPAAA